MQNFKFKFLTVTILAAFIALLSGCQPSATEGNKNPGNPTVDVNKVAATVNGKEIKMEEVERGLKQQAQGQEAKMSPLELATARLSILENLIQQEVMFQKAEKEGTVPKDEDVTAEYNKTKQQSGMSVEQWEKAMQESGQTEASARESIKKSMAIKALVDKVTSKIDVPKDSEIEAFYNGNKSAFVKKKGVKLAAIVVDPANNGEGDTTTDEQSAMVKVNEILKQLGTGGDFASVAREKSEDQSKFQGGDLGYISEEDLKQNYPQLASGFMNPQFPVGKVVGPLNIQGKLYIFKLQERSDKDEDVTLETPGVREQVNTQLINSRKQLLSQSYSVIAMNEAKIVNNLAQQVVDNPNELSGARPAGADTPANANTANTNSANANTANANAKPAANANANAKPAANANATANAKPANAGK
ncbi:MAG TPA: SurA N-terminal domain-containing protein [Pyrinomonadaceae bacterium]|nr:SurA N-terminal domain-containing protein [Pyrinomonadaceae bacterium]